MVHCLACVIIGGWGKLYGLVDNLACMLDVVMDVVACTFVDNKVRHVEAVLSPCGGDVWEWKSTPCGGGTPAMWRRFPEWKSTPCGGCTPAMWRRYGCIGNDVYVVL